MLLRYIVSNFKSIGHPLEFSMLPAEGSEDGHWLKPLKTRAGDWQALCRGGFFGPNASGKSNMIESIQFARNLIVNGSKSRRGTGVTQFAGDFEDLNGRSRFEFVFFWDNEVYDYGFSLDDRQIYEEWLMILKESDFVPIFTRATDADGITSIDVEDEISLENAAQRSLASVLTESVQKGQKNQLFLNKLSENGVQTAEHVVSWFRHITVIFPNTKFYALPIRLKEDTKLRDNMGDMLRNLDTGVLGIAVSKNKINFRKLAEELELPDSMVEEIESIQNGFIRLLGDYYFFSYDGNERTTNLIRLKFTHKLNGKMVRFNIDRESDGTRRLLDLLPMLFLIRENSSVFFVDELDRSLHTKLSQFVLQQFLDSSGAGNNQIIFTTHDVSLIGRLHQDEVWFLEKNAHGESTIKPLSDFEIKENQDTLKSYLAGRFGAVPVV